MTFSQIYFYVGLLLGIGLVALISIEGYKIFNKGPTSKNIGFGVKICDKVCVEDCPKSTCNNDEIAFNSCKANLSKSLNNGCNQGAIFMGQCMTSGRSAKECLNFVQPRCSALK